ANGVTGWVQVSAMAISGNIKDLPVVAAPTLTPTKRPTLTFTPSPTPTFTQTPSVTPSPTPNPTTTMAALTQTAEAQNLTQVACTLDYATDMELVSPAGMPKNNDNIYVLPVNT